MHSEIAQLKSYGQSLIGKTAQSTILTMISDRGGKVMEPAQKITAYSIQQVCEEPVLMVTLGGEEVFEWTLCGIC